MHVCGRGYSLYLLLSTKNLCYPDKQGLNTILYQVITPQARKQPHTTRLGRFDHETEEQLVVGWTKVLVESDAF